MADSLPIFLWRVAAVLVVAHAFLLISRREVAARAGRVSAVAAFFVVARLALLVAGTRLERGTDIGCFIAAAVIAALMLSRRPIWLVHGDADQFRKRIATAARGLFLRHAEPVSGRVSLTTKGTTREIRYFRLSDWTSLFVVVLPRSRGRDKISLLIKWLDKQYSGPTPRPRISLKRSE